MRRILSVAFVASAMFAGALFAAEALKSGLQPGDAPPAYNVKDCTGPSEGKSLCYRCKFGDRPVVNIFAREMTPEVVALVKEIDAVVGKNEEKKMAAFVTLLTNDPDKDEATLKAIAKKEGLKNVPLTVFDGVAGPEGYKIAEKADLTVTMWVESKVEASHAFAKGEFKKAATKAVVEDTKKILK
ncbi:MAG: hypothetical protein FD138_2350 [Planctomycetota bacterium]|nr:MAG: hypothetical protein FD138_2350 [Planctomycetota bacterium]